MAVAAGAHGIDSTHLCIAQNIKSYKSIYMQQEQHDHDHTCPVLHSMHVAASTLAPVICLLLAPLHLLAVGSPWSWHARAHALHPASRLLATGASPRCGSFRVSR